MLNVTVRVLQSISASVTRRLASSISRSMNAARSTAAEIGKSGSQRDERTGVVLEQVHRFEVEGSDSVAVRALAGRSARHQNSCFCAQWWPASMWFTLTFGTEVMKR